MKLFNSLVILSLSAVASAKHGSYKGRRTLEIEVMEPDEVFEDGNYGGKKENSFTQNYAGKKGYGKKGYDDDLEFDECPTGKKGGYASGKKGGAYGGKGFDFPLPDYGDSCVICDKQNKNKPTELILQYLSDGMNSAFQPSGKATCREGEYPEAASVVVDGRAVYQLEDGDLFKIFPTGAETDFEIIPTGSAVFGDDIECYIHTSCSVPIVVGDQIGPFLVIGEEECTPPEEPECPPCEVCDTGRPESLILIYNSTGADSEYQPEKKASCRAGMYPTDATVTVEGETFDLVDGKKFIITPEHGSFSAETDFEFVGASDMDCFIHTSCSVPIVPGDQIGPFVVVGDEDCPPPPEECIVVTDVGVDENGETTVTVEFDYGDLEPTRKWAENCDDRDDECPDFPLDPLPSDWIGFYPCEEKDTEPGFRVEPDFWAYTCYDRDCRRDPIETATSKGTLVFSDVTTPAFTKGGAYKSITQVEKEGGGCFIVLLNKIDGFSAPPYYNLCKGNEFMLPDKSGR